MSTESFPDDLWGKVVNVKFSPCESLPENLIVTATAAIVIDDKTNLIVLAMTPRGLDLPGGHVEDGETPNIGLKRELKEEVGGEFVGEPQLIGVRTMEKAC
jgi:8-oxo-dGTP diphosphatase